MKRFHVHMTVEDLEPSVRFYSALFGAAPSVVKPDYAKWMLEDPRLNFAVSTHGARPGVNHLGLQTDSDEELREVHARLESAELAVTAQEGTACCYARSDKYWVTDPQGMAWVAFRSLGSVPVYSENTGQTPCCVPETVAVEFTPAKRRMA